MNNLIKVLSLTKQTTILSHSAPCHKKKLLKNINLSISTLNYQKSEQIDNQKQQFDIFNRKLNKMKLRGRIEFHKYTIQVSTDTLIPQCGQKVKKNNT